MDGSDAHGLRDGAAGFRGELIGLGALGIFCGDDGVGAFLGFVEEGLEFDDAAVTGFEGLAVFAGDGAKGNVMQLRQAVVFRHEPLFYGEEELFEVVPLAEIRDDDDAIGPEVLRAVERGREIGGA